MHALIIEDEFLIALTIEDILRELGFTSFDWATTPSAAVSFAHAHPPDLITADVDLSPGDGVAAVLKIKEEREAPVVFVTGNPERVALTGAVVVSKPFCKDQIDRAYRESTRLSRLH